MEEPIRIVFILALPTIAIVQHDMMQESVFNPTNGYATAFHVGIGVIDDAVLQARVLIQLTHEVDNLFDSLLSILCGGNDIVGIGIQNLVNLVFDYRRMKLCRTNTHIIYLQTAFYKPFYKHFTKDRPDGFCISDGSFVFFLSLLYIYIISYFFYKINKQYLITALSIKIVGQCLTIYIEDFSYRIMEVNYVERITIRLDEVEKELLQEYAEENDTTVSQVIRRLIKEFLDEKFER
jgi:hypothetical protein